MDAASNGIGDDLPSDPIQRGGGKESVDRLESSVKPVQTPYQQGVIWPLRFYSEPGAGVIAVVYNVLNVGFENESRRVCLC